jgi:single-stranded DNA-binding protein
MGKKLEQTKNSFKLIGKVTRIDKDGAYKEEVMSKGKKQGETYRSLRFGVKTSNTNDVTVQMFDFEPEFVYLWDSKAKKSEKIAYGAWQQNSEMYREQGLAMLASRIGLEYGEDEKGKQKLLTKGLPTFEAQEEIFNHLSNGDSVVIEGDIRFSTYKNRDDQEVEQKSYNIKRCFRIKDVDFDAENFEEVTYFEQQMVFVDANVDKKEGKAYVTGRIINYDESFHDTQMIVNFKNEEGKNDPQMVKLAEAFVNRIKFGDVINVFGDIVNRVIITETEEDPKADKNDLFADFGGKKKPKHAEKFTQRTYIQEMSIQGIDGWDKKVYSEDDFVKEKLVEENNPFQDELGGKKKKNNPFDLGEEAISDEELPF